jgi:signal transduction protein with GAF and PtsI domain
MKKELINYETFINITKSISHSKVPEEIVLMTVDGIKDALDVKGCALFLINKKSQELELAASFGLSDEYINKGPLSAMQSIADSLKEGPVAIYDVSDDPRIQYPEAARKDLLTGIAEIGA